MKARIMKRSYPLIIEGEEGNYCGYFPDLPGCTTGGKTIEEIKSNGKEALFLYLEDFAISGEPLPDATEAVAMEMVEIDEAEIEEMARSAGAQPAEAAEI